MSSTRRSPSEINILAMLDRHEAGGLPQRVLRALRSRQALFWYGAAGVVVVGMIGTLAWLARDNGTSASVETALAGAVIDRGKPAALPSSVSNPALVVAPDAPSEAPPAPAAGATIVEMAPEAPPPTPAQPAAAPGRALPPQQHAGRIMSREAQRDPQRLAAQAATLKAAPRAPSARPHAANARGEARLRRQAAAAKPAPDAVDTDVALISAIIQHANKQQEAEEAARKP